MRAFNDVVGTSFFPRYLEPFAASGSSRSGRRRRGCQRPGRRGAEASVLKIHGENYCGRGVEGTGFLYADDRLMTNAHVVAGVDDPEVLVGDDTVAATSCYYNPDLDIAVLAFDDGRPARPAVRLRGRGASGSGGARLPEDGPYDVQAARIRAEQRLRIPDIYGDGSGRPRGVLAARARPSRQLRRAAGVVAGCACSA